MGVKKKLQLTSLPRTVSIDHDMPVRLMGQLAISQPNQLIFGVNLFTSLRKLFAFYRLISASEWGLFSLRS